MPGVVVLESMWNKKGRLLDDEPSVLPYLKAIRQSLAWEGIRVNLVYRRFYSSYDLGLLLEEVRRRRRSFQVCYIASHGQRRKLVGIGDKVIRLETLVDYWIGALAPHAGDAVEEHRHALNDPRLSDDCVRSR